MKLIVQKNKCDGLTYYAVIGCNGGFYVAAHIQVHEDELERGTSQIELDTRHGGNLSRATLCGILGEYLGLRTKGRITVKPITFLPNPVRRVSRKNTYETIGNVLSEIAKRN